MNQFPFCDASLSYENRTKDFISSLTLQEKVQQLGNHAAGVSQLGVPAYKWWSEALHGVASVGYGACKKLAWEENFTCNRLKVTKKDLVGTFQPLFRSCVEEGHVSGVMCSYNRVNGIPTCADPDLLKGAIRGQHNLDDFALLLSRAYMNPAICLNMNCGDFLPRYTYNAVKLNKIEESFVDRALIYSYTVLMRLSFFDGDPQFHLFGNLRLSDVCSEEHQKLALDVAKQGIVLLDNNEALSLSKNATKNLAVIGPNSNAITTSMLACLVNTLPLYKDCIIGCLFINCTGESLIGVATKVVTTLDVVVLMARLDQSINPIDISFAKNESKIGRISCVGYPNQAGGDAIAQVIFEDHDSSNLSISIPTPNDFLRLMFEHFITNLYLFRGKTKFTNPPSYNNLFTYQLEGLLLHGIQKSTLIK
ncbi:hypothetical protein NC653_024041 [Populus alba x Populus x berolinensis]|uniref:Glycoside hydrolase family 3 N-terminal domain-containing protein n=1 Tax=Populus alba x Populus x berolinensis TaxID=444605 RepID=A0AAD6MIQ3_9ROSI|nr:hypothetical protein NC653_024035 [Populus alba x Populus x berolinensis]KAJ6986329.1 hypothetical protein NC653_024041 [Populus alba x Populus x berolinensis]